MKCKKSINNVNSDTLVDINSVNLTLYTLDHVKLYHTCQAGSENAIVLRLKAFEGSSYFIVSSILENLPKYRSRTTETTSVAFLSVCL